LFTTQPKKVIVSVINDLATDQRVQKSCLVLKEYGYEVLLVGRHLQNSGSVGHLPYNTLRMHLLFTKGPLFYFFFNLRLFFLLLFNKADLLYSNDLDTLLPNYLVSKLKGIPLIYDSHELFCEVPELQNERFKKRIWEKLESAIVPKLRYCITVNQSIADYFFKKYSTRFSVVRNIPAPINTEKIKTKTELKLPTDKRIVIFQGSGINIQRGAEELVESMRYLDKVHLLIIGGGDVFPHLKELIKTSGLGSKITIIDKLPKEELIHYTKNSDLGLSIDKDTNLNYRYSLPNKLFDYIQAGIPVLASRLPEIERIISAYEVGDFIDSHDPKHIAEKINLILNSPRYSEMKNNTVKAVEENNWEKEKETLLSVIRSVS
jgi:glycosyltransferase involved in cell wall biosynthesis